MDSLIMRIAFAIIIGILGFYVYTWWQGTKSSYVPEPNEVPQTEGITMYGNDTCPWCQKQKEYFEKNSTKYKFVDCSNGGCPSFVSGLPTLVVDGDVRIGYQEI